MIVLGKNLFLEDYFIDENAVITDKSGTVQKQCLDQGRPYFKGVKVHKIQMWTNYGYRDTKIWVIHHLDANKLNNKISNLVYLTREDHTRLHMKGKQYCLGKHHSEETRAKISAANKGEKNPRFGKSHSEESRAKIGAAKIGLKWWNNGIKNVRAKERPQGFKPGRIKLS